MQWYKIIIVFFSINIFNSCINNQTSKPKNESLPKNESVQKVSVTKVEKSNFYKQITATGKLLAKQKAELTFNTSGKIQSILVKNGDFVNEGEIISRLHNDLQILSLKRAEQNIKSTKIELNSLLLGVGSHDGDTLKISKTLLESLKIQSGYNSALLDLEQAKIKNENTFLRAPFSGIISNLEIQSYNVVSQTDKICSLTNNNTFYAQFSIIESEIPIVNEGMLVTVIPMAYEETKLQGKISEINPEIDENGLSVIKAEIQQKNVSKDLLSGMNVDIIINESIPNQITLPKKAVVLRSNKKVVFTVKNNRAIWNYVTTTCENKTSYCIGKGISIGDTVITSGSLHIAHDSPIEIVEYLKF